MPVTGEMKQLKPKKNEIISEFIKDGMQVEYLSEGQLVPFKELIEDSMNQLKAEYGKEDL